MWKIVTPVMLGLGLVLSLPAWSAGGGIVDPLSQPRVVFEGTLQVDFGADETPPRPDEYRIGIRRSWHLAADGKVYNLDFGGDRELTKAAWKLVGKKVFVVGAVAGDGRTIHVITLRGDLPGTGMGKGKFLPFNPGRLVGMDAGLTQQAIAALGYRVRLLELDGVHFPGTCDLRMDRVNIGICNGKIACADIG
jgi:hypothetical protein